MNKVEIANIAKYRGKDIMEDDQWVYGYYIGGAIIQNGKIHNVDPDTVGRYIYTDNDNHDIYIGDLVRDDPQYEFYRRDRYGLAVVEEHILQPGHVVARYLVNPEGCGDYNFDNLHKEFKLVGNIYDNKNLLTQ